MTHEAGLRLRGCVHCGLVHRVPAAVADPAAEARCTRCGGVVMRWGRSARNRLCAAIALAALICFPLGITLPVLRLEQLGHTHEASIWSGGIGLITHGQIAVGLIVLFCSIVIPLAKIGGLFVLATRTTMIDRHHHARLHRWVDIAGRWGMIDVLLVALVVAAVKVGDLVTVTPGPGVVAFTACVVLSLLASVVFDPHAIWE